MPRKSKNKSAGARGSWLPEREKLTRVLATTTTIVLFLALSIGLLAGRGTLQARAAEVVREPVQVRFNWPPLSAAPGSTAPAGTWLDLETQRSLTALALTHLSADPFDAASLDRARQTLAATGWFATGPTLRRESAGVIRVEGTWRVPFAVVRSGATDHLVTLRGERLPKDYPAGASGLAVILGATQPPPSAYGQVWSGTDVHAGLMLLHTLRPRPWSGQVAAIDVSEFARNNRRQLLIETSHGNRIRWGGPADAPLPGEEPTSIKLRHLESAVAGTGRIDSGQPHLDIRFRNVFVNDPAVQSGR